MTRRAVLAVIASLLGIALTLVCAELRREQAWVDSHERRLRFIESDDMSRWRSPATVESRCEPDLGLEL